MAINKKKQQTSILIIFLIKNYYFFLSLPAFVRTITLKKPYDFVTQISLMRRCLFKTINEENFD